MADDQNILPREPICYYLPKTSQLSLKCQLQLPGIETAFWFAYECIAAEANEKPAKCTPDGIAVMLAIQRRC